MAKDLLKSAYITNLDATPVIAGTTGEGPAGYLKVIDGYVTCTAAGIGTQYSTYALVRVPTNAKIKSVLFAESTELDTHSADVLVLDFNMIHSDSTVDGTPAALQSLVPTTTGTPTTYADGGGSYQGTETIGTAATQTGPVGTAYTAPNILFGKPTLVYNAIFNADITFTGTNYKYMELTNTPLWNIFGYQNSQGQPADPGGFFDLVAVASTAATTGAAGDLYAKVTYVM